MNVGPMEIEAALQALRGFIWEADNVFNPAFMLWTILIALVLRLVRRSSEPILHYLFPREDYRHPSTRIDLKLAASNFFVIGLGLLNPVNIASFVSFVIAGNLQADVETPVLTGLALTAFLVLGIDLGRYLSHRLHHKVAIFWPFHAVHHSAEVLTPITASRVHPVYFFMNTLIISTLVGIILGVGIRAINGPVDSWVFVAPAVALHLYFFAGAHIRHSHIWFGYPRWLEHILISPAQHQIHHSTDLNHRDKNFGEIFAIWDWLFGTLYVTREREELKFGLSDDAGEMLEQQYPTYRSAMLRPFLQSVQALSLRRRQDGELLDIGR